MEDSPLKDIQIGYITSKWAAHNHLPANYKEACASTNDWAKEDAFSKELFEHQIFLYLTDKQLRGRGRKKADWVTPRPGSSLLSSWSFMVDESPQPHFSPRVGLALYRAALSTWPYLPWNLKAPNDLYLGAKKVAGLLLENITQGEDQRLVVGLGLNLLDSPKEVPIATSIVHEMPKEAPLLGEDWTGFLDRWLYELSSTVGDMHEEINTSDQQSLLAALNRHPKASYTRVDEKGNLFQGDKKIGWETL